MRPIRANPAVWAPRTPCLDRVGQHEPEGRLNVKMDCRLLHLR